MRCVDAVVAGNSFLALGAAQAPRVHTIPTCVEPSAYQLAQHAGEGTELVWIGSSSTLQGLEAVTPLLERLGRDWPGLRLKLVCDRFLHLTDLPVVARPWSEATEAAEIATADIGISWLPDDDWSRGKCGLKVLQYMAAGLPVVANPVGVQTDLIRHGESGFLAATADAWSAAVGRLVHDAQLRRCMGAAGRRRVERDFSVTSGAARWLALLADLSTKGHAA
jgi:glycosyltransferase involved in cell wall biosynthesis